VARLSEEQICDLRRKTLDTMREEAGEVFVLRVALAMLLDERAELRAALEKVSNVDMHSYYTVKGIALDALRETP
jgi:hypothetical protein